MPELPRAALRRSARMLGKFFPLARRLPRALRILADRPVVDITFEGDFATWAEAKRASSGYEAAVILERTRESLLKIRRGEATFERDSVVLDAPEYPFPLIACLARIALQNGGALSVLDFGGSLGSSYFQCRAFLGGVQTLRWSVVEQAHYVDCGREDFEDDTLRFYYSIQECLENERPDVILLSGVVQCLEDPYEFVKEVVSHRLANILVDRTPFIRGVRDLLTVERVPARIYPASYPSWFLREQEFRGLFTDEYRLLVEFPAIDRLSVPGHHVEYKGFHFERR